ncbi:CheR family methyltransferase [Desulfosporosinus sp.]|uniref:CheR family methyltransferase n=1 Tax=Desulfosporosinus sp. TaxID=157907 RepID=UPI0025C030BC|nr:CheR family methyltransferase [Desulfosporosinus sp.]MBC2727062.1 PAS domain-containing protein [Desulfosporosinus sp.]
MSLNDSFPVVGIGVSDVGGKGFKAFFKNIPDDCGMAFVIVGSHEMTVQILQEYISMPVLVVKDDIKMMPNHVFICPKDKDTGVVRGDFYLREPLSNPRKPLDYFFSTLAYDQGENAICIILSGISHDGALGLKEIKAQFGMVMVQDEGLAGCADSADSAGKASVLELADYILPIEKMCDQLLVHSKWLQRRASRSMNEKLSKNSEILKRVLFIIQMHNSHDFSLYKKGTIYRRIESRMRVCHIQDIEEYVRYLQRNAAEVETLFKAILINVTRFFRDSEAFQVLENQVIPELLADKPEGYNLRIWIPGCSSGEEVYSLAIIIQECMNKARKNMTLQLFATDIDEDAVLTARTGLYPLSIAEDIHPERLKRFFKQEENRYRISKEIRETIIFASHDLIKDPPFIKVDMISCRNLLIYFENSLQKKISNLFHFSLLPNGILFLGPSESFGSNTNLYTVLNSKWKLYKRRDVISKVWANFLPNSSIITAAKARADLTSIVGSDKSVMINSIEKMLLENYTPPCFIVNEKGDIIYINGRSRKYFELATGEVSLNIATMVKEEMRYSLRAVLRQAAKTKEEITIEGVRVIINDEQVTLNFGVRPIEEPGALQGLILVIFEEVNVIPVDTPLSNIGDSSSNAVTRIDELENELKSTKVQLFRTIEEIELSYMETAAANEELHSANEELQSSNEEMETSREEMQSLYEEVVTVNNELQTKLNELAHSNDDMTNLLNSTEIAFIFLDSNLNIMRYTPLVPRLINIIPSDVGRPLAHLVTKLRKTDIVREAQRILETYGHIEKEVETIEGVWYLMRLTPYRTSENMVAGVVVSFVNISKLKALNLLNTELRDRRDYAFSIIEAIGFPLLVLDGDFKVITANFDFYRVFQVTPLETEGTLLSQLSKGRWNTRELEEKITTIITEGISSQSFLLDYEFPGDGNKKIYLDAYRINSKKPSADLILVIFKTEN